ncbi:hypothetical protein BpHYR1_042498 [Brachionus plicatilis]|uniref:Uncharacterized protein n=1 Tax=Brachionus plicatilis TaxID=10195 RepID=A0A3M7SXF0_BRAPC|nr:hypothetical protein BpHYR1_042498 [Brachionus plicatilis]
MDAIIQLKQENIFYHLKIFKSLLLKVKILKKSDKIPRQKQLLDHLKGHKLKSDFVQLFCSDIRLRKHIQIIFNKPNSSPRKNTCLIPTKFNLNTLYNVSINDSISYSICSKTFTTTALSGKKNCQRSLPLINLGNPRIENISAISSDAAHAHSGTFTHCLKHLTSILIYLKINQNISYLNNKINQFVSSHETKGPVKRNYLKKIILKPNMLDFNSFNTEGFVEDLDLTVKKRPKLKEPCEVFVGKKRVHLDSNNSEIPSEAHKTNQIDESDDLLHHTIGHDMRCFSEPPNLRLNKSFITIKYFQCRTAKVYVRFESRTFFTCTNRSFSSNRIKLDKEVVKKSPSFEKFLKNILQGKKKSNSLCNFSSGSRNFCNDQSSTRDSNSSLSDNLDNMMVSMMNGKKKSSWPVLKIEDQEKNFEPKTNMEETEANNDGYIPENVRNALEQAGINIDEIINMTNQLQMSFKKDSDIKKSMVKSHTFSNEQITTTRTIFTNEEKTNFETKLENLIDNIKSFEVNEEKTKSNGQLVSVSSWKNFEIKQNLRAKMSQQVENKNEPDQTIPVRPARNNRKKSASNRYATVSNFRLASDHEAEISPCWNSNYCSAPSTKIIPAKVVGQFKPVVNIHKRLSATPVAEMTKMINSKSTDTFSNLTDCSDFTKEEPEAKFIKLSESSGGDVISSVHLTENLPTRQIKKGSVIRSFSYNIGNIYGEGIKCKKPVSDSDSFGKVIELCKNKKALFSVNESLDMSEAENVAKNCMETKNFSGLNTDRANPAVVVGRLNSAISQNKLPNIKMNQSNKNLISLLGSFQDQTITISKSKSSINLPNSFSTSSLSGVLHNEFEIYQNNEEFLRSATDKN